MIPKSVVRWNDGTYDKKRKCDECGLDNCSYPVYNDCYKEIITKKTYWNYLETKSNEDYLPSEDNRGTSDTSASFENSIANPDLLQFQKRYTLKPSDED